MPRHKALLRLSCFESELWYNKTNPDEIVRVTDRLTQRAYRARGYQRVALARVTAVMEQSRVRNGWTFSQLAGQLVEAGALFTPDQVNRIINRDSVHLIAYPEIIQAIATALAVPVSSLYMRRRESRDAPPVKLLNPNVDLYTVVLHSANKEYSFYLFAASTFEAKEAALRYAARHHYGKVYISHLAPYHVQRDSVLDRSLQVREHSFEERDAAHARLKDME